MVQSSCWPSKELVAAADIDAVGSSLVTMLFFGGGCSAARDDDEDGDGNRLHFFHLGLR